MTAVASPDGALRRRSVGPPAARSVLLTVLGEYVLPRGGVVWQESLVAALAALDHTEQTARQAVARSTRDGWLVGERLGRRTRMTVAPATTRMLEEGGERIFGFGPEHEWDGRWLVVVLRIAEDRRSIRARLRTRLGRIGLGSLGGGVWIAPHADREPLVAAVLRAEGAGDEAVSFLAEPGSLGRASDLAAAWDFEELAGEYHGFLERFSQPPGDGPHAVFRAQTELVHAWRRLAFLDPDLPAELLPRDWPRPSAYALFQRRNAAHRAGAQEHFAVLDGGRERVTSLLSQDQNQIQPHRRRSE